jgi:CheY-like chemotaxis protein
LPASSRAAPSERSLARATRQHVARGRAQRVLIVDDNCDGAEMLSHLLAAAGHEVVVANDPSQALSIAAGSRPEVAILDIGLPVMDGYALARELRARLGEPAPIFIALTGYGLDRDKRRSEEAGFSVHLVKPVDADALVETIDELVTGRVRS